VEQVQGTQFFLVEAQSAAEALQRFWDGKSTFEAEEIEVTSLSHISENDVELAE